jgi:predicted amidohydrolase
MYRSVQVAAVSLRVRKWDKKGNAAKMESYFAEAAREKPEVIVSVEGALEGYVVMDVVYEPERDGEMLEIAEPIDGPYIQHFQSLAAKLECCLCFGFAERVGEEVFNCGIFIDKSGRICGKYHKTQLAEGYHPSWSFNRIGRTIRAFDTPIGRAGIVICNDRSNPRISRTLVLDGARVIFIPTHGSRNKKQNGYVLARARENGVPVVQANAGMSMIVSKGEMVAYQWGYDRITHGVIEVPAAPSTEAARKYEAEYMELQGPEMAKRYAKRMAKIAAEATTGRRG